MSKRSREPLTLQGLKLRFFVHSIAVLTLLALFTVAAIYIISAYNAKMALRATISEVKLLRSDNNSEIARFLYSNDDFYNFAIVENYDAMREKLQEAYKLDRTFSLDMRRLISLIFVQRRIMVELNENIRFRGFSGTTGEYATFLRADGEMSAMLEELQPLSAHADFFAMLATANLMCASYSNDVKAGKASEQLTAQGDATLQHLQDLLDLVSQLQQAPFASRERCIALLQDKMRAFERIRYYDQRITELMLQLDEADANVSRLLEQLQADISTDIEAVRRFFIFGVILFFLFGFLVVFVFAFYIIKINQYGLRRDVRVAELANEAKTAFLSNISHEIRSPLNAVLGLDELIIRESTESAIVDYAVSIQRAGKTLLTLINDVLDFSKIEAGKIELIPVEYDLASVVGDLYSMIAPRAQEKKLTFSVQVDPTLPHVLIGDETRIKQCILNLLTNGVKYTHQGGITLDIGWKKHSDGILLTVSVSDTGIGIRESDMPKLFKAFERIEERRNRTIEGSGLGLAIVTELLALMDSKLEVQSEYGKGSRFSFAIAQQVADWNSVGNNIEHTYRAYQRNVTQIALEDTIVAPDARILVVDDTAINLTVIQGLLKPTQIQVDTALSGHEALQLVTKNRYDLIFLDHRMPVMDGIETLRFMQTLDANLNKDVPCIALTANAVSGAREMYLREGFSGYLSKPVDLSLLKSTLVEFLPQKVMQLTEVPDSDGDAAAEARTAALAEFAALTGIDSELALKNCVDADVLRRALIEFYNTIEEKAAAIAGYAASADWRNYVVAVHALKSTARLIGATALSEAAAALEHCGDKAELQDAASIADIAAKTPALLAQYRRYRETLSAYVAERTGTQPNDARPELAVAAYREALASLSECMQVSDFDLADQIITMLDGYRMDAALAAHYAAVKAAVTAVDPKKVLAAASAPLPQR